jgi:hypothetical protein
VQISLFDRHSLASQITKAFDPSVEEGGTLSINWKVSSGKARSNLLGMDVMVVVELGAVGVAWK